MGIACCKQAFAIDDYSTYEDCIDVDFDAGHSSYEKLEKELKSTKSIDRNTWFTEQCSEDGDEDFYTKDINLCDFDVKCCIGMGAFSKVYLVTKKDTLKQYAMKVINKSLLKDEAQKDKIYLEKEILQTVDHPFIVKMHYTFQTPEKIYFILDFVNGGELHSKILEHYKMSERRARVYAAEILMALKHLHEHKIVYRDLKSRNILLDAQGHIKLVDFGLSKFITTPTEGKKTVCGTMHYVAPEMLLGQQQTEMVDYWSFGVLLYEMLHGYYPFGKNESLNSQKVFNKVLKAPLKVSKKLSKPAKNLLEGLLKKNPLERLGAGGIDEIMTSEFFKGIQWDPQTIKPLYVPKIKPGNECKYIADYYLEESVHDSPVKRRLSISEKKERHISGFSFTTEQESLITTRKCTEHKASL